MFRTPQNIGKTIRSANYLGNCVQYAISLFVAFFIATLFISSTSLKTFAQESISPEQFKAAFLFHLLNNVEWQAQNKISVYRIALVGSDPTLLNELERSVKNNLIKNRAVEVEAVNTIAQMKNYHLLFISATNNIPLRQIANATTRTNTLLVTEDTLDKTNTMVNLLSHEDGTYTFEINKANITYEFLKLSEDILLLGGSEMDVAELYRDATNQLAKLKEDVKKQADALEKSKQQMQQYQQQYQNAVTESERIKLRMQKQARLLEDKNRMIESKNVAIREKEGELLAIQTELQQASESLQSNQQILGEKLNTIADKEKEVSSLSELIAKNEEILRSQTLSISQQKEELEKQRANLLAQGSQIEKQQSWLIFGSVVLLVFSIFLMVIIYLNKERRKTNLELVEKNLALSQVQNELLIARDQAQAANEAKSSFLANMSHEIRTPMNAIIGMLHLTKQTMLNLKQVDYINKIDTAANSLLQIINDILDFSKVEAGELKMEETEFSLSKVLDDLANLTGIKIQQKGLEFIYDIAADIPERLIGDPLRLSQVLVNLTNNAMKFTEKGEVKLKIKTLQKRGKQVDLQFQIIDTGIGMNDDVATRLFKPFSQADSSTTRKFGGTGLGLAICKRLVEQMHGDIRVQSKVNQGSVFTFKAKFGFVSEKNILDTITRFTQLQNYRVLVVVHNEAARESLKKILSSFRCTVSTAKDFENYIGIVKTAEKLNRGFDNIIFDYKIALEHEQEIKRLQTLKTSKVTLLLSNICPDEELLIEQINPDITINKPVTPSAMLDALMPLVDESIRPKVSTRVSRNEESDQASHFSSALINASILIVEDNVINQEVAKEVLSQVVKDIDLANDGQEAVNMVKEKHYDCILMDIQMPVMDGYEAARQIRRLFSYEELPIIAMTANAMGGDKEKCLAAGMNDYVSKPLRIKNFFNTLDKWFNQQEQLSISSDISPLTTQANIKEPEAPTIDIEGGTELMGDKSAFINLLVQFQQQQGDFVKRANLLILNNEFDALAKEAHNLKGVAANLFIDKIPSVAAQLDLACRNNNRSQATSHLKELDSLLKQVVEKISSLNKEFA